MNESLAYLNGKYLPFSQLAVKVFDAGFMLGAAVAEQIRTFGGRLFRLEQHLHRLERSLQIVNVDPGVSVDQMAKVAAKLAAAKHAEMAPGDDLGLCIFITPGTYGSFGNVDDGPVMAAYTYPLKFDSWAAKYQQGEHLVISTHRQVPSACWPAELKCRSRMHYFLADREASCKHPGSRALLLDLEGRVTEASTANILACFRRHDRPQLVSPPRDAILPGVSVAMVEDLARELEIEFTSRELWPADLFSADEVLLTSTSMCILPVVRIDDQSIGVGKPGPMFQKLIGAWSQAVEVDIVAQAMEFRGR